MKIKITFSNSGGELDSRTVNDGGEEAVAALIDMIEDVPELHPGDTITVTVAD